MLVITSLFIASFQGGTEKPKTIETASIALLPFRLGKPAPQLELDRKSILDCTISGLCYLDGTPLEDSTETMNDIVQKKLKERFGHVALSMDNIKQTYADMVVDKNETLQSLAIRFGKRIKAQHVLAGTVWRFEERRGTAIAASSAASVGFALFLVNVSDGAILWENVFEETQQPLTENILNATMYVKKGLKWFTAKEFAAFGVEKVFAGFPVKKK
jgi:hypothetical protein